MNAASSERAPSEELARDECLMLLRSITVGRIALATSEGAVVVVPVNYVVDGEVIVFRSGPGEKLEAIHGRQASFQIDFIDHVHRTGWSVLVRGTAHRASQEEVSHLHIEPWEAGEKAVWVRIVPTAISGRRIATLDIPLDTRGYL